MLLIVLVGLLFGSAKSPIQTGVLAYATEMSSSGLLSATNAQRSANGKASLAINAQLASAAQTKANDMAARNYWSHNTPDGKAPWYFVEQAGYSYTKAGENLAYGFGTSSQTVTGWMNSPTHRANMLDSAFTEVGFGFINSADYNNSGEETIVVAMYGQPQVAAATAQVAPSTTTVPSSTPAPPASQRSAAPSTPTTPANQPTPTTPEPTTTQEDTAIPAQKEEPVTTASTAKAEPQSQAVSRVDALTKGKAPWIALSIGLLSIGSIMFLVFKHSLAFKRALIHGEQFILHHPLVDIGLTSIIMLGYVLSQTAGFIK